WAADGNHPGFKPSTLAGRIGRIPEAQVQLRCALSEPGRGQKGWLPVMLFFFRTSRLIRELKLGADTQTSSVCPDRDTRCFFDSDEIALAALRLTLPSFSGLDLNGHFGPLHVIFAFRPFGNCWVICRFTNRS